MDKLAQRWFRLQSAALHQQHKGDPLPLGRAQCAAGANGIVKKLSECRRRWLTRRAVLSNERRLASLAKRRVRRLAGETATLPAHVKWVTLYSAGKFEPAIAIGEAKLAPETLSLGENYEETSQFLRQIRASLSTTLSASLAAPSRSQRRHARKSPTIIPSYWDFSSIRSITPAVALLIASEYDAYRRRGGWVPKAVDLHLWDRKVLAMLNGVGFLELTGIHPSSDVGVIRGTDWTMLRFRAGHEADGEEVSKMLAELGAPELVDNTDLYGAIVEALVNTKHHAYPPSHAFPEPHVGGWWLTGFVDRARRQLRVSVFDHGLTIPGTLQTWSRYPIFLRGWKRMFRSDPDPLDTTRDGAALAIAMMVGRTSTGHHHRGKGLHAMEETVNLCKDGQLAIYSRCGEYRRRGGERARFVNRTTPIGGTLIIWDMRF